MTAQLFVALLTIAILAWVMIKGGKTLRGIAAFLLMYGLLRILETLIFGNGFTDFVRGWFTGLADAFRNFANPNPGELATLIITVIIVGILIVLLLSKTDLVRLIAGFALLYIVIRIFDAVALGNGFSEFITDIGNGLSESFGTTADNMP